VAIASRVPITITKIQYWGLLTPREEIVRTGRFSIVGPGNNTNQFHRAADYVDKILRGTKPADIPVEQPTQFRLVVNLKTAKALGLTIPESFLLRADEVRSNRCASRKAGAIQPVQDPMQA
jgi:ABC-type uncharacterized transport system substrate-binding protein